MSLKDTLDAVLQNSSLQAEKDKEGNIIRTHCNSGATLIANALGCHDLDNMIADQQYMFMSHSNRWTSVNGAEATNLAMAGELVFACLPASRLCEPHGHIACVYPAPRQFSGSLKDLVPMVANVGVKDIVERVSQAFPVSKGEPDYFWWNPTDAA